MAMIPWEILLIGAVFLGTIWFIIKGTENFTPIKLVKTNVISKKGYYDCAIAEATYQYKNGAMAIKVVFEVFKGKYSGFKITDWFYDDNYMSKVRLSYLCEAVAISGHLTSPKELLGKKLRLRVVPKFYLYEGKKYRTYHITRFHGLDWGG